MRNTRIEESLNRKVFPRYLGPLIVIRKNKGGAYILCEMDGATLHQPVAEFRVIPYYARKSLKLPENIHDLIDINAKTLKELENAETRWDEPLEPELLYPEVKIRLPEDDEETGKTTWLLWVIFVKE